MCSGSAEKNESKICMTEAVRHAGAELWAVTSYFNPEGYQRRRQNYRVFRERLKAPLAAIELSFDGRFELGPGDADLLIQLHGGDVMWQKERLLNFAIARLPAACRAVAWLDCDIVFSDDSWPEQALEQLRTFPLLHLFRYPYDLGPDGDLSQPDSLPQRHLSESFVQGVNSGRADWHSLVVAEPRVSGGWAAGLAWAMTRDLWSRHGLYDASILGGADRMIAAAAYGMFDVPQRRFQMSDAQMEHYLAWAEPFHASVQGRAACLQESVFHLWHGDIANRRRPEIRFGGFSQFGFDPQMDIVADETGLWRWSSEKPEMHQFVRNYFAVRKEDG